MWMTESISLKSDFSDENEPGKRTSANSYYQYQRRGDPTVDLSYNF